MDTWGLGVGAGKSGVVVHACRRATGKRRQGGCRSGKDHLIVSGQSHRRGAMCSALRGSLQTKSGYVHAWATDPRGHRGPRPGHLLVASGVSRRGRVSGEPRPVCGVLGGPHAVLTSLEGLPVPNWKAGSQARPQAAGCGGFPRVRCRAGVGRAGGLRGTHLKSVKFHIQKINPNPSTLPHRKVGGGSWRLSKWRRRSVLSP